MRIIIIHLLLLTIVSLLFFCGTPVVGQERPRVIQSPNQQVIPEAAVRPDDVVRVNTEPSYPERMNIYYGLIFSEQAGQDLTDGAGEFETVTRTRAGD